MTECAKRLDAFGMWMWRWMERLKWTNKKKCSCATKSGRRKDNVGTDKEGKRNWLGHWLRWNCLMKDALEGMVNGKRFAAEEDVR